MMGVIAPWFGKKGMGIQYLLPNRVIDLINANALKEVTDNDRQ